MAYLGWGTLIYCVLGALSLLFFMQMPWFLSLWDCVKIFLLWPLIWYGFFRQGG